jgi:hypothetical protein
VNPALNWTKKNWPVIVSGVVIMGSLPTAWYFANNWNKKIKDDTEKVALKDFNGTKVAIEYVVANPVPGEPNYTFKYAPNEEITKRFVEIKNELAKQAKAVIDRVNAFNKGVGADAQAVGRTEHALLVPELFPGPTQAQIDQKAFGGMDAAAIQALAPEKRDPAIAKALRDLTENGLRDMVDRLTAARNYPDPYAALVKQANAGEPPAPSDVLATVQDRVAREIERIGAGGRELTPEERAVVAKLAQDARMARYQGATRGFSLYMNLSAMGAPVAANASGNRGTAAPSGDSLLRPIANAAAFRAMPSLENDRDLFLYQWDLWMMSDVISAVRMVNTENGKPTAVEQSVVKRIDRLAATSFSALEIPVEASSSATSLPVTPATPGAEVKPDYKVSITGRSTSMANPDYDVRNVVLTAVVSSERLPALLDALSRVNFNTVLEVKLADVDTKADLEKGFYYGNDHVVRATITLETVWLRQWMSPVMPVSVKKALGVPEPTPEVK